MSMDNITVIGIRPPDEEYKKKLAAYRACEEADVEVPRKLQEFFGYKEPNDLGVEINLTGDKCINGLKEEYVDGCLVHLELLPHGIKLIKFRRHY